MERYDKASNDSMPADSPVVNGHIKTEDIKTEVKEERATSTPPAVKSEDSGVDDSSPPKKKRKSKPVDDAELAAMLQAQENSRARPTRGGEKRKAKPIKKPRKKSAKKVKADDSDVELNSEGEPKEKEKKGGFHVRFDVHGVHEWSANSLRNCTIFQLLCQNWLASRL